jgi:hypothetical protein
MYIVFYRGTLKTLYIIRQRLIKNVYRGTLIISYRGIFRTFPGALAGHFYRGKGRTFFMGLVRIQGHRSTAETLTKNFMSYLL